MYDFHKERPYWFNLKGFLDSLEMSIKTCPTGIHLLKVNNRSTRTGCEICSKLPIKTLERRHFPKN